MIKKLLLIISLTWGICSTVLASAPITATTDSNGSQSVQINGSLSVTGVITGTATYANNASTAAYATGMITSSSSYYGTGNVEFSNATKFDSGIKIFAQGATTNYVSIENLYPTFPYSLQIAPEMLEGVMGDITIGGVGGASPIEYNCVEEAGYPNRTVNLGYGCEAVEVFAPYISAPVFVVGTDIQFDDLTTLSSTNTFAAYASTTSLHSIQLSTVTAGVQVPSIAQYNSTALSTGSIYSQLNNTAAALSVETTNRINGDSALGISTGTIYSALKSTAATLSVLASNVITSTTSLQTQMNAVILSTSSPTSLWTTTGTWSATQTWTGGNTFSSMTAISANIVTETVSSFTATGANFPNGFYSGGKSWQVIFTTSIATAVSSYTVVGLNGDADIQYRITHALKTGGTATEYGLYFNGDNGAYSYGDMMIASNGTSLTTQSIVHSYLPCGYSDNNIGCYSATIHSRISPVTPYVTMNYAGGNYNKLYVTGTGSWGNTSNITNFTIFTIQNVTFTGDITVEALR